MAAKLDFQGSHELPVDRETVFDYVSNPLNDPEWCPLVASCEQIKGNGPAPGAVYRWDQILGEDRSAPMDVTLVAFEPPGWLEWELDNEMMGYRSTMSFEPIDAGATRIIQHNQTTVKAAPEEATAELQEQAAGVMFQQFENLTNILS